MALKSKIGTSVGGQGGRSLRTTIPVGISEYLGVRVGDYLYWNMGQENDTRIIILRTKEHQILEEESEEKTDDSAD